MLTDSDRLEKDHDHGMLLGILAGIGKFTDTDPVIVRLTFCLFGVVTGFFPALFVYITLAICIPSPQDEEDL